MNYGHKFVKSKYDLTGAVSDHFALLKALGVTKIRLAYPPFDSLTVAECKRLVEFTLSRNFYVTWGVTAVGQPVNTARWSAFKSHVLTQVAPWARSLGTDQLQLSIGNEEELHIDGTTMTVASLQADLRDGFGSAVRDAYTRGPISYEAAGGNRIQWANGGVGALDKLGFNLYYETNPNLSFKNAVNAIASTFGEAGYVSEYSTANGFADVGTEKGWAENLVTRQKIIQAAGISDAYYFCFCDGSFGVPADSFALMTASGKPRTAMASLADRKLLYFS
jgi:hypothetical protein